MGRAAPTPVSSSDKQIAIYLSTAALQRSPSETRQTSGDVSRGSLAAYVDMIGFSFHAMHVGQNREVPVGDEVGPRPSSCVFLQPRTASRAPPPLVEVRMGDLQKKRKKKRKKIKKRSALSSYSMQYNSRVTQISFCYILHIHTDRLYPAGQNDPSMVMLHS